MDPKTILDQLVAHLKIRTAFLPDIDVDHPFAPSQGGNPSGQDTPTIGDRVLQVIKPGVEVTNSTGSVMKFYPSGEPPVDNYWPYVKWGGIGLGAGLALYIGWRILK